MCVVEVLGWGVFYSCCCSCYCRNELRGVLSWDVVTFLLMMINDWWGWVENGTNNGGWGGYFDNNPLSSCHKLKRVICVVGQDHTT